MKTICRAFRPFEVKDVNVSARTFEGISAAYSEDFGKDVIHQGAFAKTLQWWREKKQPIPLLDQHNGESIHDVLGSMTDGEERAEGLWSRFEVDEGDGGEKLLRHVKKNRLGGLSIGYEAVNPERDKSGVRHLREVKLWEISAVIWPMNPDARIDTTSVKSLFEGLTEDQKAELRAELEAEAKAELPADPMLPPEQMAALRARLFNLRLRPLLARHGGASHTAA